MALFYNGTNIPASANVYINNQAASQVLFNNALVWKRERTLFYNGSFGELETLFKDYRRAIVLGQVQYPVQTGLLTVMVEVIGGSLIHHRALRMCIFPLWAPKGPQAVDTAMPFEYPIWFDQEYEPSIKALNNAQRTAIVKAALTALENAGYYAGLYASANWVNSWLNYTELTRFDVWAAQYGSVCGSKLPFGMWQYLGGGGTCAGISGACDRDYAYKDYPAIIKGAGLNGFAKADTAHPAGDGGDGGSAVKEQESEQPAATPAVTLYTLKIGPMSVGDKNTLQASAKVLGIPVTEAE